MASSTSKRIAVIGLGRFGMALARRLSMHGADVVAIDSEQPLVDELRDDVAISVRLDCTDEAALRSQEIDRVDSVVVAIGENFEAALLATVICKKNLQVPHVICRAQTPFNAEIFRQIGADEVIQPEQNAGDMLGHRLAHPRIKDYVTLGEGFTVVEMLAPSKFVGKTLQELKLRLDWHVNLIAIRRHPEVSEESETSETETDIATETQLISVPGPHDRIEATDVLLLAGAEESLAKLPQE